MRSLLLSALIGVGLTLSENTENTEELFHLGHILHEAGQVAEVAGAVSSIAFAKQPSPAQVIGTILDDADKVAEAIEPVVEVIGDVAGDAFHFHLGHVLHEAGDVAEVAGAVAGDAFHFHLGHALHEAGDVAEVAGAVGSIALAKKQPSPAQVIGTVLDDADKVAKAIEPVVEIIGDVAGDSFRAKNAPAPDDELFHLGHVHLGKVLHDASNVAEVAGAVSSIAFAKQPSPAQVIGTILDDADKVAEAIEPVVEVIGDVAGDAFHFHLGHVLHEAGDVAEVAGAVGSIALAKQPSPAQVIGTILDDADKVAEAIEPVVEVIGDVAGDAFHFHLGHVLHEAGDVAEVAGAVGSLALEAEPKKFLGFF